MNIHYSFHSTCADCIFDGAFSTSIVSTFSLCASSIHVVYTLLEINYTFYKVKFFSHNRIYKNGVLNIRHVSQDLVRIALCVVVKRKLPSHFHPN